MAGIYEWVRSLVFYLILMTMILNLLPDKKYEKYLRLFAGTVFILLVFGPFADLAGLEARVAGMFEKVTFQNDVKFLRRNLEEADSERLSRLLMSYRQMVETDLSSMAAGFQVECLKAEAVFEENPGSADFGSLREVRLFVGLLGENTQETRLAANREIVRLKKKIGEYYGLEEGKIAVTLENQ